MRGAAPSPAGIQVSSVVGFLFLGCAAPGDLAIDRESTVIISYWGGDEVLNPVHDRVGWREAGNILRTTGSGPSISAPTSAGTTASR